MKFFSMFTGIGGFELGIIKAYEECLSNQLSNEERQPAEPDKDVRLRIGETLQEVPRSRWGTRDSDEVERSVLPSDTRELRPVCIGYSEIDKYASQVFDYRFPNTKNYGDCTKINAKELPDFDLLVGGFPCQSFSIAGKRKGFDDTRGTLFFDIARILKEKRPENFILENVKGLLSHDNGRTFKTIIATLAELGYGVEWQVLNSKNFGVPQNRERVFIVGHLGGQGCPKVFPIGKDDEFFAQRQGKISPTITQRYYKQGQSDPYIVVEEPEPSQPSICQAGDQPDNPDRRGGQTYPADNELAIPVLTPDRINKRQNGRRFKTNGEPSFTITGQDIHGVSNGMSIRRLTPTECERLQGFPDNWTSTGTNGAISDTQRYKMCGNAVTTNVVTEVVKRLFAQIIK